ncbi:MAG: TetR/AcrR family transcriptional regulator [Proteobacteria bacterium]|nr:TetR/AcrR family transcriptional regulator [Pseudomonadota bacterium]
MGISKAKSDPKKRHEKILDAARELFFRYGYRGTSMSQIAAKAGYSKRTIYLDYHNKDELFMHLVAEGLELLLSMLLEIPHEKLAIEDALAQFFKTYFAFYKEHKNFFRLIFNEATPEIVSNSPIKMQQRVSELERRCMGEAVKVATRAVQEKIVIPIDPWEAAGIFLGSVTGIILLSMGGSQTVFSDQALGAIGEKALKILWRGILAKPTSNIDIIWDQ